MFLSANQNHQTKRIPHARDPQCSGEYIRELLGSSIWHSSEKAVGATGLDEHPEILDLVAADLIDTATSPVGRMGLSAESVLRCLLLKQQLRISYEQLAFHLSDSVTYRAFARLGHLMPSRSGLQSTIRRIRPETLEQAYRLLTHNLLDQGVISLDTLRIDSTVVASNIAPPSDSQLLNDAVRVISRLLATATTMDRHNIA